jgi:hypothetical protein
MLLSAECERLTTCSLGEGLLVGEATGERFPICESINVLVSVLSEVCPHNK